MRGEAEGKKNTEQRGVHKQRGEKNIIFSD
jgi:hypothetical protein